MGVALWQWHLNVQQNDAGHPGALPPTHEAHNQLTNHALQQMAMNVSNLVIRLTFMPYCKRCHPRCRKELSKISAGSTDFRYQPNLVCSQEFVF